MVSNYEKALIHSGKQPFRPSKRPIEINFNELGICGIKFVVFLMNLKKEHFMKKIKVDTKKLQLKKVKIVALTTEQIEIIKGGDGASKTKTIKSFDVGCTYGTF